MLNKSITKNFKPNERSVTMPAIEAKHAASDKPFAWRENLATQLLAGICFLSLVATTQWRAGGLQPELYDADEPAHYVTGVMVYEYLHRGDLSEPLVFAEDFYLRYPKVAFGHWPPLFYAIQGGWYLAFGPSKPSALLLVSGLALLTAWCLYRWLRRRTSQLSAFLAASLFLLLPITSLHTTRITSEMLVELICLFGFFFLVATFEKGRWLSLCGFAFCIAFGLLTKETVFPLLFSVPLAIILSGRLGFLRNKFIWLAAIGTVGGLYFLIRTKLQSDFGWHGMRSFSQLANWIGHRANLAHSVRGHFNLAHPTVLGMTAVGIAAWWSPISQKSESLSTRIPIAVAISWLGASLAFGWLLGRFEARYLMPTVIPIAVLFAVGLDEISERFQSTLSMRGLPQHWGLLLPVALGIVPIGLSIRPIPPRVTGFSDVAQSVTPRTTGSTILISSDSPGEGSFIVERMIQDREPDFLSPQTSDLPSPQALAQDPANFTYILRASKVLGVSGWSGEGYEAFYETEQELLHFLNTTPVHYIVFDQHAWAGSEPEMHHKLLIQTLLSSPSNFKELGRFPLCVNGSKADEAVCVYENIQAREKATCVIEIDMRHSLQRPLTRSATHQPSMHNSTHE